MVSLTAKQIESTFNLCLMSTIWYNHIEYCGKNLSTFFVHEYCYFLGKTWPSFLVYSCYEHCCGTKRRSASLDWPSHCCWCLLCWLPWGAGLEVWTGVRGITEVQGRKIYTREVQNCEGELVANALLPPCGIHFVPKKKEFFHLKLPLFLAAWACHGFVWK